MVITNIVQMQAPSTRSRTGVPAGNIPEMTTGVKQMMAAVAASHGRLSQFESATIANHAEHRRREGVPELLDEATAKPSRVPMRTFGSNVIGIGSGRPTSGGIRLCAA